MNLEGTLIHIDPQPVDHPTRTGGTFRNRMCVIRIDEQSPYPQEIQVEFQGEKCSKLDLFQINQRVSIAINLRGSQAENGRRFVNITGWKIDALAPMGYQQPGVQGAYGYQPQPQQGYPQQGYQPQPQPQAYQPQPQQGYQPQQAAYQQPVLAPTYHPQPQQQQPQPGFQPGGAQHGFQQNGGSQPVTAGAGQQPGAYVGQPHKEPIPGVMYKIDQATNQYMRDAQGNLMVDDGLPF